MAISADYFYFFVRPKFGLVLKSLSKKVIYIRHIVDIISLINFVFVLWFNTR